MYIGFLLKKGMPENEGDYLLLLKNGEVKNCRVSETKITVPDLDTSHLSIPEEVEGYLIKPNSLIKSLHDYPYVIEQSERDHYEDRQTRQEVEDRIAYFSAELELDIWLDPEYKNEGMRRAAKTKQLHESEEFLAMDAELETAKHREFSSCLRLERLKREYSVLKLEKQEAIARIREV